MIKGNVLTPYPRGEKMSKFTDAYNTLETYLKSLVGMQDSQSIWNVYLQILPPKIQAPTKTINHYRNTIEGHGTSVLGTMPTVPDEWVIFLLGQLNWVKKNEEEVKQKMLAIINSTQTTKPQNQYPQFQEADQIITCQGCGSQFYFTAGEQRFYKEKGLNIPKYCKTCRAKRNVKDPK